MNFRKVKQILNRKLIEIWSFTYKHIEKKQKERLMRRCRNLELRIKLDEEINKIQIKFTRIYTKPSENIVPVGNRF